MEWLRVRVGSGLAKALVVCLLAGVFVMHGLTSNHDATSALSHHPTVATHHAEPVPAAVEVRPGADHGHIHSMEDVCLGMLGALLLALVVALALRSSVTAHPAVLAVAPVRVIADGPLPPCLRPALSKLCVLRT